MQYNYKEAVQINKVMLYTPLLAKYKSTNKDVYRKITISEAVDNYRSYLLLNTPAKRYNKSFEEWLLTEI